MPNFDNLTPPTSAFIDENNDIQDIQSVLESGAVVVTSVAPGPVTPIGVATTPKFENIAPWAGKFVNSSNEIIELIEFLTSGAISVQITGTHGDAPVTGSYITKIDETALMTNSIPLSGLPSGFLSSTTVSGDLITRIFSGTANQVSVLNGDGSAPPVWSLPNVLIAPGTFQAVTSVKIGASGATVTTISTDSTLANNSDQEINTQKSLKAYIDNSSVFSEEIRGYFDGLFVETPDISFSSDGATITLSLQKLGGGDLTILYSTGEFILDSTPPVTISLTAGTDDSPIENYIYIPIGTKVLTVSTSGFPSAEEYCAVAEALCQTAASVQVDGLYKTHEWTSHMSDEVGNGHSSHLDFWIRRQNATWLSGVSLTPTLGALQFSIATSVGEVLQLHKHAFSAFDTSTGSHVYVQNSFSVPYQRVTDLTSILTDANGASMSGKNFNLVVWGSVNSNNIDQLYINVPSATYSNDSSAINDIAGTSIYTIGDDFKGNGFLISRLTVKHQAGGGGVWSLLNNEDLRGKIPSNAAGGGTGGIDAVVEDTTPQLGGDLDVNGFIIRGVSATVDFFSSIGVNINAPQTRVVSLAYIDLITNRIDFSPVDQSFRIDSVQRMRITSSGLQLETGATVNNIDNTGSSVLATDLVTAFAMQSAISDAIDSGVSFRGTWDASVNVYPSTGGSGAGGAIETGNWWYISVAGTLGANPVESGDRIFAIADTPGQSDSNWIVVIHKVDSVFGRVGAVLPVSGDYSFPQVTGLPATATAGSVMQGSGTAWQEATISQGTGISINNVSGTITVTNSSPDQTVAINNGAGISVIGGYPNFTITNTDPDQTVVLNSGVGISVTGTYPNFTIDNTATSGSFVSVSAATQALSVNTTYYTTFAGLSVMTLPVTAAVGTPIRVMAGPSGNTFKIAQNAGQQIFYGSLLGVSQSTTVGVGGDLSSTEPNTSVLLMCVVADTQWQVISNINQLNGV